MLINHSSKTGWFQLSLVVFATAVSFFFIKRAFEKPFVEWQTFNEVRAAEIKSAIDE